MIDTTVIIGMVIFEVGTTAQSGGIWITGLIVALALALALAPDLIQKGGRAGIHS
ncbi:MAG TPA: hypothetical protein P5260_15080 [Candidatus Competibacter sp.]|nr:hypothetical protein [Candidatus Competibacter sp.]